MKVVVSILISLLLSAHAALGSTVEEWNTQTDFWPVWVKMKRVIENEDAPDVRIGRRGLVSRVEGEEVILDFGGEGIHRVAISDTDFVEEFDEKVTKDIRNLRGGIVGELIGNKLFLPGVEGRPPTEFTEYFDTRYFLIYYAPIADEQSLVIAQDMERFFAGSAYEFVTSVWMPTDEYMTIRHNVENLDGKLSRRWKAFIPQFAPGYRKYFSHDVPDNEPTLVLIDRNGRIVYRAKVSEDPNLTALTQALSADVKSVHASTGANPS
ncbi:MAG: hypothetical protein AAFX93_02515 [Verrucomicrobiota bacterium]